MPPTQTGTSARETAAEIVSTPTPSPSPSPSPTNIFMLPPAGQNYSSFETPLFPFPTHVYEQLWETPTPIATTSKDLDQFRLKEWKESDAIDLIRLMEEYTRAKDIPSSCMGRYSYYLAQNPLKLAIEEFLIKFPESSQEKQIRWRLALSNVTLSNQESDEWLISEIESGLNQGRIDPEDINQGLSPYGFGIVPFDLVINGKLEFNGAENLIANNLFGDGRDAHIFRLRSREIYDIDGSYIAIKQDERGYFSVELIHSGWNFNNGGGSSLELGDHTQDGIPEVIIEEGVCGCSCNSNMAYVYQWRDEKFIDLGQGKFDIGGGLGGGLDYAGLDENGIEFLEISQASFYAGYSDTYQWNQNYYEFIHRQRYSLFDQMRNYESEGDYLAAAQKIDEIVANWPVYHGPEEIGPSYLDTLRFKQGTFYSLLSMREKAREVFDFIVKSPSNPENLIIPQAAQAFLNNYSSDFDLVKACNAANNEINKAIAPYRDSEGYVDGGTRIKITGYYFESICAPSIFAKFIIEKLKTPQIINLPSILRELGFSILESHKMDLDNDGDDDWIILTDEGLWLVVNLGDRAESYLLDDRLDYDYNIFPEIKISSIEFPTMGSDSLILKLGDHFYVFQILNTPEGVNFIDHYTGDIDDLEKKFFSFGDQYALLQDNWRSDSVWSFYLWDSKAAHFDEVDIYSDYFLNAKTSPDGFHNLEMLNGYIDKQGLTPNPRWLYLQALGYELTGEAGKAADIYYRLWREHPDSAYALMARAKLEPVSP